MVFANYSYRFTLGQASFFISLAFTFNLKTHLYICEAGEKTTNKDVWTKIKKNQIFIQLQLNIKWH